MLSIRDQALQRYIINTAKVEGQEAIKDSVSIGIVDGTQLIDGTTSYLVTLKGGAGEPATAFALISTEEYKKGDPVYIFAVTQDISEYNRYFIFGKVAATQQAYFRLSEWDRFETNSKQLTNDNELSLNDEWEIIDDAVRDDIAAVIDGIAATSTFAFECNVTGPGEEYANKNYGLRIKFFDINNNLLHEETYDNHWFTGQPAILKESYQRKIFKIDEDLGRLNKIQFKVFGPENSSVQFANLHLCGGTVINEIESMSVKVTIEQGGKNFLYNDSNDSNKVILKAITYNNNQEITFNNFKYIWQIKKTIIDNETKKETVKWENIERTIVKNTIGGEVTVSDYSDIFEITREVANTLSLNFNNTIRCIMKYDVDGISLTSNEVIIVDYAKEDIEATLTSDKNELGPLFISEKRGRVILKCNLKSLNKHIDIKNYQIEYFWYAITENQPEGIFLNTTGFNNKYEIANKKSESGTDEIETNTDTLQQVESPIEIEYPNGNVYRFETGDVYFQNGDENYIDRYFYMGESEMDGEQYSCWLKDESQNNNNNNSNAVQKCYYTDSIVNKEDGTLNILKNPGELTVFYVTFTDSSSDNIAYGNYYSIKDNETIKIFCKAKISIKTTEIDENGQSSSVWKLISTETTDSIEIRSIISEAEKYVEDIECKYCISDSPNVTFVFNKDNSDYNIDDSSIQWIESLVSYEELFNINLESNKYLYYTSRNFSYYQLSNGTTIGKTTGVWTEPKMLRANIGGSELISRQIDKFNTFNALTEGGVEQGIKMGDVAYKTLDETYNSNKRYYTDDKGINEWDPESTSEEEIQNAFEAQKKLGLYEVYKDRLYINAEFINTGALKVGNTAGKTLFYADIDGGGGVQIGGFEVAESAIKHGETNTDDYIYLGTDGLQLGEWLKVYPKGGSDSLGTAYISSQTVVTGINTTLDSIGKKRTYIVYSPELKDEDGSVKFPGKPSFQPSSLFTESGSVSGYDGWYKDFSSMGSISEEAKKNGWYSQITWDGVKYSSLDNASNWSEPISLKAGQDGKNGEGIASIEYDDNTGNLVIEGTIESLNCSANIKGKDGNGITEITMAQENNQYYLVIKTNDDEIGYNGPIVDTSKIDELIESNADIIERNDELININEGIANNNQIIMNQNTTIINNYNNLIGKVETNTTSVEELQGSIDELTTTTIPELGDKIETLENNSVTKEDLQSNFITITFFANGGTFTDEQ